MASGSPTGKGMSQIPKGPQHRGPAVERKKRARFHRFMQQFSPKRVGSAKYQRMIGQR